MLIGITGSIATGKSVVGKTLKSMGYKVIDTDVLSHRVIKKGRVAYYEIIYHFSDSILMQNKEIDRKKLGDIIFNDFEKKKLLESIIHPKVVKEIKKYAKQIVVFFEVPLLFEANLQNIFDRIIVVETTKELQLERLMQRNNLSEEEAKKRIMAQMPSEEKVALGDYVIHNHKDVEDIKRQLQSIIRDIVKEIV